MPQHLDTAGRVADGHGEAVADFERQLDQRCPAQLALVAELAAQDLDPGVVSVGLPAQLGEWRVWEPEPPTQR